MSGEWTPPKPESAEERAASEARHALIGREAAIRIILGLEDATEPDGDLCWRLTDRALIALDRLGWSPPIPTPRIAYGYRERFGGAVCPGCDQAVEVGDEAVQWTDDAITHKWCERPPIVEVES